MGFHKDIAGQRFGRFEVIGDTGKRDQNRNVIVIARNIETGELHEGLADNFKRGRHTGYIGSSKQRDVGIKNYFNNKEKIMKSLFRYGVHSSNLGTVNFIDNVTGYRNVYFNNHSYRWYVKLTFNGKKINKSFIEFEDAVLYVNNFRIKNVNPLINNKEKKYKIITQKDVIKNEYVREKQELIYKMIAYYKNKSTLEKTLYHFKNAKGYSWKKDKQKWKAYITLDGKQKHLGYFDNEVDAIEARQKAVNEKIKKLENEMERI